MAIKGMGTTMYQWDMEYRKRGLDFYDNLETAFKEIAASGLDGVQSRLVYADTDQKAEKFIEVCKNSGLKLASLYGSSNLYDKEMRQSEIQKLLNAATSANRIGCSLIALDMSSPKGRDKTDDELKIQVEGLNKIGAAFSVMGMRLAVHNHTPEMKNEAREFRYVMDNISEKSVGACLDIAWATMSGVSAVELINAYHHKLFDIHVRNFHDGNFTQSVTEGSIPYSEIFRLLKKYNYDGWLILELAYTDGVVVTRPFIENFSRSLWYLKGLTEALWG